MVICDVYLVDVTQHAQHTLGKRGEIHVILRQRRGHRVHDELCEPFAEHPLVTEQLPEKRC